MWRPHPPVIHVVRYESMGSAVTGAGDFVDQTVTESQEVDLSTFANMQTHFDGQVGAFAYLFVLLYALRSCHGLLDSGVRP